jgi:hypothetical protein
MICDVNAQRHAATHEISGLGSLARQEFFEICRRLIVAE